MKKQMKKKKLNGIKADVNGSLPSLQTLWVCNSCGSAEYTGSVSDEDIEQLGCGNCGGDEFHKEQKARQ